MKNIFKLLAAIVAVVSFGTLNAKEPTNWMIGVGVGAGQPAIVYRDGKPVQKKCICAKYDMIEQVVPATK